MEQQEMGIVNGPQANIPELRGLGSTLFTKMLAHKNATAVTCGVTAHNETYEQLLQDSILAASEMRRKGIKPNDLITICSDNFPDCLTVYCASLFLGAIPANIDPHLSTSEVSNLLKQIKPKMIFVDSPQIKLMKLALRESQIETQLVVFGDPEMNIGFSTFFLRAPEKDFVPVEVENLKETACVVFTSGLTKAACLTHYGLLGHVYSTMGSILSEIPVGYVVLVFSNLSWASSIVMTIFSISNGCNQVLFPRFDANFVWNLITEHKPNLMFLTPWQILEVCKNGRPKNADTASLKFILLTGDRISKEQIRHVRDCFPATSIINCYSQTELNGTVLAFRPITVPADKKIMEDKPDSIGKPLPGYMYKIIDVETQQRLLGPFHEGELCIKSDFTMNGYYNNETSHEPWDSEGFFKTGDLAYYDDELCFFIKDRIEDLTPFKSSYVSSAEIEERLLENNAVLHASVVFVIKQFVGVTVLKEEAEGKVSETDLEEYVKEKFEELEIGI